MLLNIAQCTRQTPTTGIIWSKMSIVRRLRDPNLDPGGGRETENETSDTVEIMKVDNGA